MDDAAQRLDKWTPKNFEGEGYSGRVSLRTALAKSLNEISMQLVIAVTPGGVVDFANRVGLRDDPAKLTPVPSIALGSEEAPPIVMVNSLATFAAGGVYMPPRFIEAIDGKPEPTPEGEQVVDPKVAYIVVDLMRSVVEGGTASAATALKIPIVGKTGTSNGPKDTWFIGMTPDYAIGVWVGYDDSRIVKYEQGATTALPIWMDLVKQMNLAPKSFKRPDGIIDVDIDTKTGLLAPKDAEKGTMLKEVFIKGTEPTEEAPPSSTTDTEDAYDKDDKKKTDGDKKPDEKKDE